MKCYFNISCKSKARCLFIILVLESKSLYCIQLSVPLYTPYTAYYRHTETYMLGHTLGHCDLVPLVIEGRIIGKRPPGRPRAGMLDRVKDGSPNVALKRFALDREL